MDYYKEFDDYVSQFNLEDINIKLKYNHSYRVMELSKKYSKLLGYSKDEQDLASIIGLLHDIGRFKQLEVYHTYNDKKSIDHAEYGADLLFKEGLIKKFWNKEEDYETIEYAIRNHNKYILKEIDDEKIMKFSKLVRDMDKIDILLIEGELDELHLRTNEDELSKEVIDSIMNHIGVDLKYVKNRNDHLAICFSYPYDINNDITLEEIKKNLISYYKTVDESDKFEELYKESIKYIDERIGKKC